MKRFLLRIAGITVECTAEVSVERLGVDDKKWQFIAGEGLADVKLVASRHDFPDEPSGRMVFDAAPVWQLFRCGGTWRFRLGSASPANRVAVFNDDFTSGEVVFRSSRFPEGEPIDPLPHPLDQLLWVTLLSSRGLGAEMHACGLIDPDGFGHLFAGTSGTGKTTMARLWKEIPGVRVLSDDRIILRREGGKVVMHGTPWHGEGGMAEAASNPLAAVYFPSKGPENKLVPLDTAAAAAKLMAYCFPPMYSREGLTFTLDFLGDVARDVPCHDLQVFPDRRVVDLIRGHHSPAGAK